MDRCLEHFRNAERTKMAQATKVLKILNKLSCQGGLVQEKLLVEKLLLEAEQAENLISNKSPEITKEVTVTGRILATNFQFQLKSPEIRSDETLHYVLIISNSTEIKASKISKAIDGFIEFSEDFAFSFGNSFRLKIQIYSISIKRPPRLLNFLQKFETSPAKLLYRNPDPDEGLSKTSFKLCGETEVIPHNFQNSSWRLNSHLSTLDEFVEGSVALKDFRVNINRSGFLTLGQPCSDLINWNRCWCSLSGGCFKIFASPEEDEAFIILDLKYCHSKKIELAPCTCCPRSKSFLFDMKTLNKTVKRYFFRCDNNVDLNIWISDLNAVVSLERKWKNILT